ncbi:hypothetical protein BPOR_0830g00010 [Botrytis porri]|uniref:Uncharacterized protein n=1 Tax=Botrytis porri TaxID=87229 RepID=A0A4Z1KE28_9HELO|nr:hypothetical protein BPOR_0830g00010 [Botrytis porri]
MHRKRIVLSMYSTYTSSFLKDRMFIYSTEYSWNFQERNNEKVPVQRREVDQRSLNRSKYLHDY